MPSGPVRRSWLRRARLRAGLLNSYLSWLAVGLVALADGPVLATAIAYVVGLAGVWLFVVVRGPSPTEAAVAEALRTGQLPEGLSLALVDTRAASLLRQSPWMRFALLLTVALVAAGAVLVAVRGMEADRVARWAVMCLNALAWGWATTTSVREARRWRAGEADRWAARSAARPS